MKTLEFKLSLNHQHQAAVDQWLEVQRRTWNGALEILLEFDNFASFNKADKAYYPCCPLPWGYTFKPINDETECRDPAIVASLPKKDKQRTTYLPVATSRIGYGRGDRYRLSCPMPQPYRESRLIPELVNAKTGKSRGWESALMSMFAHERHDWLRDSGVPSKITNATIKTLCTAWKEYQKGKRKQPRFKSFGRNSTLSNEQNGTAKVVGSHSIQLPKLGKLRCRGLGDRWPKGLEIKVHRILKKPSGYYLMLVGDIHNELRTKHPDCAIGIDPGVAVAVACSDGKQYRAMRSLQTKLKRLRRLQRQLDRRKAAKGSNYQKTLVKLRALHEKIARQRKVRNHEISSIIAETYGGVAIEDTKIKNMTRRPKAKLSADGTHYEHNQARAKAGLNRALLDRAIGQFRTMLKDKVEARSNEFHTPPAPRTSITCSACGTVDPQSRRSQSEFLCVHCGHADNADHNASKNIASKAPWTQPFKIVQVNFPKGNYPAFAGEVKPASDSFVECQQEAALTAPPEQTGESSPSGHSEKRERMGVNPGDRQENSSILDQAEVSQLSLFPSTRAPCSASDPGGTSNRRRKKSSRKQQSAHSDDRSDSQLDVWNAAPETG